jgi:hypothetical protein
VVEDSRSGPALHDVFRFGLEVQIALVNPFLVGRDEELGEGRAKRSLMQWQERGCLCGQLWSAPTRRGTAGLPDAAGVQSPRVQSRGMVVWSPGLQLHSSLNLERMLGRHNDLTPLIPARHLDV